MDLSQLPFNRLIGLELADEDSGFQASIPAGRQYTNHLGTVHAGVLMTVAEAGAGEFLLRRLGDPAGFVPVVRRLEARFRKPASGRVSARCAVAPAELARWSSELASRGRISASVPVDVVDETGNVVMSAVVEWFISRTAPNA